MQVRDFIIYLEKSRNIPATRLVEMLGYKSRTSLSRLMQGRSDIRSIASFVQRVKENIQLDKQELQKLEMLSVVERSDGHQAPEAIRSFVQGEEGPESDVMLTTEQGNTDLFSLRYRMARHARITVVNCTRMQIFSTLRCLVRQNDATVTHYLLDSGEDEQNVHDVVALQTVITLRNYDVLVYKKTAEDPVFGFESANTMIVSWLDEENRPCEEMLVFDTRTSARVMTLFSRFRFESLLGLLWTKYRSIKRSYAADNEMGNYFRYGLELAELERDCAQYTFKPDLPLFLISPRILEKAFRDQNGHIPESTLQGLISVYQRRYHNIFTKKTPSYCVLKQSALRNFMRTGRTQDHLQGIRAYTREERREIFRNIIWEINRGAQVFVYLLRDDALLRDIHMTLLEGKGLLIHNADTESGSLRGRSDVMLTFPEFGRQFKDYYMRTVLQEQVLTQAETVRFLRELAEM